MFYAMDPCFFLFLSLFNSLLFMGGGGGNNNHTALLYA